jgi:hypothetical protein
MMAGYFSNTPSIAISPPSSEGDPNSYSVDFQQGCSNGNEVYASIDAPPNFDLSKRVRRRRSIGGNESDLFKGYFLIVSWMPGS